MFEGTVLSICLGAFLTLACTASFVLNLSMLYVLVKGRFLRSQHSPVYILAFANMVGNAFLMAVYACYLGPSCIMQSFIFPGGKENELTKLMGFLFHGQWIQDLYIQDVTSCNRLITVVYPRGSRFFTRKVSVSLAVFVFVAGFVTAYIADYVMPCCAIYLFYESYSYTFLDHQFNSANYYIDLPFNIACSVAAVSCYIVIFIYVHLSNKEVTKTMEREMAKSRKTQELKYALQFALCTVGCIFIWVSFRIMAVFIPSSNSPLFLILTIFQVVHSSANAIVFLGFNQDIKKQYKIHIFGLTGTTTTSIVLSAIPSAMSRVKVSTI